LADVAALIADAVVSRLNEGSGLAGSFSEPLTACRRHLPYDELSSLPTGSVQVSVVPRDESIDWLSRSQDTHSVTIDVAVQRKLTKSQDHDLAEREVDTAVEVLNQVKDRLNRASLAAATSAKYRSMRIVRFIPEHLDQDRVYTGLVSVTYSYERGLT